VLPENNVNLSLTDCVIRIGFFTLYIHGCFNDGDSTSDYIAQNGRAIREQWIAKGTEGSGRR
jgi:hypothetical protein